MGKLAKRGRKRDAQLRGRDQIITFQTGRSSGRSIGKALALLSPLAGPSRILGWENTPLLLRSSPKRSARGLSNAVRGRGLARVKARLRQERASKGGL